MVMRKRSHDERPLELEAAPVSATSSTDECIDTTEEYQREKEETILLAPILIDSLAATTTTNDPPKSLQIFRVNEYNHDDFPAITRTGPADFPGVFLPLLDDDDDDDEEDEDEEDNVNVPDMNLPMRTSRPVAVSPSLPTTHSVGGGGGVGKQHHFEEKKEDFDTGNQQEMMPLYHDESWVSLEAKTLFLAQYVSLTELDDDTWRALLDDDDDDDDDEEEDEDDSGEAADSELAAYQSRSVTTNNNRGTPADPAVECKDDASDRSCRTPVSTDRLEWFLDFFACSNGLCHNGNNKNNSNGKTVGVASSSSNKGDAPSSPKSVLLPFMEDSYCYTSDYYGTTR